MKKLSLIALFVVITSASAQFRLWFSKKQKEMPRHYTFTDSSSIVKDQGVRAACASFAFMALIENELKNIYGVEYNLSEQYLTYFLKHNRSKNEYTNKYDCFDLGREIGFVQEAEWPYHSSYFSTGFPCQNYKMNDDTSTPYFCYSHQLPPAAVQQKKISIDYEYVDYSNLSMSNIIKHCNIIYYKQRKYFIEFPTIGFENALTNKGIITIDDSVTSDRVDNGEFPYHFANIVGYDLDKKWFIIKNSWGVESGDNGYFYLPFYLIIKYNLNLSYIRDFKIDENKPLPIIPMPALQINAFDVDAVVNKDQSLQLSLNANIDSLGYRMLILESYFYIKTKQGDSSIKNLIKLNNDEIRKFKMDYAGKINTYLSDSLNQHLLLTKENLNDFSISKELILCPSFQSAINTPNSELIIEFILKCSDDTYPNKIYAQKSIVLNKELLLNH